MALVAVVIENIGKAISDHCQKYSGIVEFFILYASSQYIIARALITRLVFGKHRLARISFTFLMSGALCVDNLLVLIFLTRVL